MCEGPRTERGASDVETLRDTWADPLGNKHIARACAEPVRGLLHRPAAGDRWRTCTYAAAAERRGSVREHLNGVLHSYLRQDSPASTDPDRLQWLREDGRQRSSACPSTRLPPAGS